MGATCGVEVVESSAPCLNGGLWSVELSFRSAEGRWFGVEECEL